MHSIPFPNDSFDANVCGRTFSYRAKPAKALKEILNKSGGIIGIEIETEKNSKSDKTKQQDNRLNDSRASNSRFNSISRIVRKLPKRLVQRFNYHRDAELKKMKEKIYFKKKVCTVH